MPDRGTVTAKVCIMAPLLPLRAAPLIVELREERAKTAWRWSLRGQPLRKIELVERRETLAVALPQGRRRWRSRLLHALFTSNRGGGGGRRRRHRRGGGGVDGAP